MNTKKVFGYGLIAVLIALAFTACNNDPEPAHVHQWGEWTQTTAPACEETGVETRICTLDSSHTETRIGAVALGHDWNTETGLCDNNCGGLYYNLGDTGPGGGKIFYVSVPGFTMTDNSTTAHYLEATPADMTVTSRAWASASYTSTDITGTATAIGTGRKNTTLILATDTNAPAALACKNYNNGGKTDWFLPSKDELNQLYVNRNAVGSFNTTVGNDSAYLSSSQTDSNNVWVWIFSNGVQGYGDKVYASFPVRAVRAF